MKITNHQQSQSPNVKSASRFLVVLWLRMAYWWYCLKSLGLYSHTSKKFDNLTPLRSYVLMFTGIIRQIDPLHRTEIDPLSRDKSMTNNKELNTGNIGYFEL